MLEEAVGGGFPGDDLVIDGGRDEIAGVAQAGVARLRLVTFDVVGAGTSPLDLDFSAMAAAGTFTDLLPIITVNDGQIEVPAVSVSPMRAVHPDE